jgi:hypothetical protein
VFSTAAALTGNMEGSPMPQAKHAYTTPKRTLPKSPPTVTAKGLIGAYRSAVMPALTPKNKRQRSPKG